MTVISQLLHIKASNAKKVYEALATKEGLASWWAFSSKFSSKIDDVMIFHFTPHNASEMRLVERIPDYRVMWECQSGDSEWVGTTVAFELEENGNSVDIKLFHSGWQKQTDYFNQCNYRWTFYLQRLKAYLETGKQNLSRF